MATRRLPLVPVLLCTLLALVSAVGVYALFGGGDDSGASDSAASEDGNSFDLRSTGPLPGSTAEVRLSSLGDGPDRALGDFMGDKPVVLNFFAYWCVPCREEMPALEAVHQDVGEQVNVVGLAVPPNVDRVPELIEATGVTYPTFSDADSSAVTYFGGTGMPTTVFIDAEGEVVDVVARQLDEGRLRELIDEHLGVPA